MISITGITAVKEKEIRIKIHLRTVKTMKGRIKENYCGKTYQTTPEINDDSTAKSSKQTRFNEE